MKTLFEQVTDWMYKQQYKHGLGDLYTEREINALTQFQFLERISEGLENMIAEADEARVKRGGVK